MKSVHYLLCALLPAILNAADGKEFRMQLVDRDGTVHELKNQEDYLQVPAQHLQMAATVRHSRAYVIAHSKDLTHIETAELPAVVEQLEIEMIEEYYEWFKSHEMAVWCCGNVCPMLLSIGTITALTDGVLNTLGLYSTDPDRVEGIISGIALGSVVGFPLIAKISTYIKPDQSEKTNQIKRLQDELESRKNK